ncbi:bifunctional SulP family inorganic anion transporter/carbonic anhydrase [Saccharopolyspora sp. S2-29]|uniref:carbonic anhydrase n=1 Tax=Saccharopolyspora mangrovi TaxID=3082379 RepID=A0ABU6A4W4_9PSEU|nr:bifunctional SulP family inorganic anion transporter/carbonic anhydrase [Saccharopolyspora sp. S2-29]MEB3366404.1 bifunctional SulP family inorganic anion transporter/carbonic anhydrase [Saccharopolyspora sp. S2-29]
MAIPLSLGIALASGAPIMAGLVAAVVGGIVAGAAGGSVLQVSGPAAGLTVVVAGLVHEYGWAVTCAITVGAGVLQILLGLSRVARAALAISPAIVHGMLAGIGIVIALAQIHVVLGGKPHTSANESLMLLPEQLSRLNLAAVGLGVLTIAILLVWPRLPRQVRVVPAQLVAVVLATAVAWIGGLDVARVEVPADLLGTHIFPALPDGGWGGIALAVVTMALIASIESLLSAVAVDRMHDGPRANLNREMVGQGMANMVSGALGGLPVTGVIVRSSTNAAAGARSRVSAVLHGVWVIVFVGLAAGLLKQIPTSVLGAMLVMIGIKLVNFKEIRQLLKHRELPLYVITALGVVELNLMEGVLLGIGVAVLFALYRLTRSKMRVEHRGNRWHVVIEGSLTFVAVPKLSRTLAEIPAGAAVDVDLAVDFLDHAAFEALHNWRTTHERLGGEVDIDEIHEAWYHNAATSGGAGRKSAPSRPTYLPWQEGRVAAAPAQQVLGGVREFQQDAAAKVRPYFEQLAEGQSPSQLFLTCSDSRVVPHLITSSGPGDLFVVRNIGNIVPQYREDVASGAGDHSVAAAIEYATEVLGVKSITVCGHSCCGAMKALLDGRGEGAPSCGLDAWLGHGSHSLARFRVDASDRGEDVAAHDELCQVNVAQQLDNLMTYPGVQERVARGDLHLIGMFFDIATAEVHFLDEGSEQFVPVSQMKMNDELAAV